MSKSDNYKRFLSSYSGQRLLKKHSLSEEGVWRVKGEDSNFDLAGPHPNYTPDLGFISGKLQDVIAAAVEMDRFWTWGHGGSIEKYNAPVIKTAQKVVSDNEELKELIRQRKELDKRIKELTSK